jgi:hypothetical protein
MELPKIVIDAILFRVNRANQSLAQWEEWLQSLDIEPEQEWRYFVTCANDHMPWKANTTHAFFHRDGMWNPCCEGVTAPYLAKQYAEITAEQAASIVADYEKSLAPSPLYGEIAELKNEIVAKDARIAELESRVPTVSELCEAIPEHHKVILYRSSLGTLRKFDAPRNLVAWNTLAEAIPDIQAYVESQKPKLLADLADAARADLIDNMTPAVAALFKRLEESEVE